MSVKFEKETIRGAPVPGARQEDAAHKLGEALTGGKSQTGYLAVCCDCRDVMGMRLMISLAVPATTSKEPIAHQNAHIQFASRATRTSCIMVGKR